MTQTQEGEQDRCMSGGRRISRRRRVKFSLPDRCGGNPSLGNNLGIDSQLGLYGPGLKGPDVVLTRELENFRMKDTTADSETVLALK